MGKGKVYPSPPAPVASGETAEAVLLRLLPAVVLAMAAPLGAEAKEVLAYLVLASLRSSAPPTPAREEVEGAGSGRTAHRPELGCGCFGCYTAYWSRWDGSPESDREAIHRSIEAFEEHLDKEEGKGGRRRKKRGAAAAAAKDKAGKGKELAAVEPPPPPPPPPTEQEETSAAAVLAKVDDVGEESKAEEEEKATAAGVEEERRRRGWDAVAGVLNWRGWGLWGSH